MNRQLWLSWAFVMLLLILGCGPKMMVPPEIDLNEYGNVGLINFSSEAKGNLGEFVTQKFLEEISSSQKGARIMELGSLDKVLESVQRDRMDPEAIQAIGKKYNVNAIITGNLKVSDIKPKVKLSSIIQSMSVKAEVEASLTVRLLETEQGATVWTNSARDTETVAQVSIFSDGGAFFDADDPEEAYGDLSRSLVKKVTSDFKSSYK
jgi:hypothetical protein